MFSFWNDYEAKKEEITKVTNNFFEEVLILIDCSDRDEEEKDNQKRKRKKTSKCKTSENEILRVESQVEKKK